MKFQCIYCSTPYTTSEKKLGSSTKCNNCGKKNLVPSNAYDQGRIIADDFAIEKLLGVGGMGSVYLVNQISLNRKIALKVLLSKFSQNEKYRSEFLKEARSVAGFQHSNLTQIYAFGEDANGLLYLGLEYVNGYTLGNLLEINDGISLNNSLNILQQIALGLEYAWGKSKIVHRDIKPDNVLISREGKIKLTDMGLARKAGELVKVSEVSGTPSYISPEQILKKPIDFRSDMYSLGILLYQCVVGILPFYSKSVKDLVKMHLQKEISFPDEKSISKQIKQLIFKLTAKHKEHRFQSYADLRNEIIKIRKFLPSIFKKNDHYYNFNDNNETKQSSTDMNLSRTEIKSLEEIKQQGSIKNEHRSGIVLVILFFLIISIAFIISYNFWGNRFGITSEVHNLINKIENETSPIEPLQILSKVKEIETKFDKDTHNILEWQAYNKLIHIKNNYLDQTIDYLNIENEKLRNKNDSVLLTNLDLKNKYTDLNTKYNKQAQKKENFFFSLDQFSSNNFDQLNSIWRQQKNLYFSLINDNNINKEDIIELIDLQLPSLQGSFQDELKYIRNVLTAYQQVIKLFLTTKINSLYGAEILGGKITNIIKQEVEVLFPNGEIKKYSFNDKKVLLEIVKAISPSIFQKDIIQQLDPFLVSQGDFNAIKTYTQNTTFYIQSYIDLAINKITFYNFMGNTKKSIEIAKKNYLQIVHTPQKYYFVQKLKKSFSDYKVSILPLKDRLIFNIYQQK